MFIALMCGLWYGYLVFRAYAAKKREWRTTRDQRRIDLLDAVNNRIDRWTYGPIKSRLIWFFPPIFIMIPALVFGLLVAMALGSFQRYFNAEEFEAVQMYKGQAAPWRDSWR